MFPNELAKKTIPYLASISGYAANTDGTLAATLENMDKTGVDISVLCSIATNARQTENVNKFALSVDMVYFCMMKRVHRAHKHQKKK